MSKTHSDIIISKIHFIRGKQVLLDSDLAALYKVETKQLKRQVKRNLDRFPEDFMFQLTENETEILRSQFGTLRHGEHTKYPPYVFTEHGVAMLSSVLTSKTAIQMNIAIIRAFVEMRRWMDNNKILAVKIKQLESKFDDQFKIVFDAIRQLMDDKTDLRPIGFRLSQGKDEN